MKVVVNRDNCIGCGACEGLYPEVFQIDDEGLSTVISEENIEEEKLAEAIEGCPTSAIAKEEEQPADANEECPTSAIAKEEEQPADANEECPTPAVVKEENQDE